VEENMQPMGITDNLLKVFNYAFVESAPYGFFVPKDNAYVAVNLVNKVHHCQKCRKEITVDYHHTGVTYFSRDRYSQQQQVYALLGLDFPAPAEIAAETEFTYHQMGYCTDCAKAELNPADTDAQKLYNLCLELHKRDEALPLAARTEMQTALERWLVQIKESAQVTAYDLSSYTAIKDLVCAVILDDVDAVESLLKEYRDGSTALLAQARQLLAKLPEKFRVYAARSTAVYESMSDEIYHEYTVVFPAEETVPQDFFAERTVEGERAGMFLQQPRISSLEELLLAAGFADAWVDLFIDHVTALEK